MGRGRQLTHNYIQKIYDGKNRNKSLLNFTFNLTLDMLKAIDKLVEIGSGASRSEIIRNAVREYLKEEFKFRELLTQFLDQDFLKKNNIKILRRLEKE